MYSSSPSPALLITCVAVAFLLSVTLLWLYKANHSARRRFRGTLNVCLYRTLPRAVGAVLLSCATVLVPFTCSMYLAILQPLVLGEGLAELVRQRAVGRLSLAVLYGFLVVNLQFNFVLTLISAPGFVKPDSGGASFCEQCTHMRPLRSHHCSICDRCVMRMDHHCVWLNKCIGQRNYRVFWLFLLYLFLCSVYMAVALLPTFADVLRYRRIEQVPKCQTGVHGYSTYVDPDTCAALPLSALQREVLYFTSTLCCGTSLAVGALWTLHLYLALSNMTMMELALNGDLESDVDEEAPRASVGFQYNRGSWRQNLELMLEARGRPLIAALLPRLPSLYPEDR